MNDAFNAQIAPATNLMTATNVTTATGSANTKLQSREMLIKCLTQPSYIRLVQDSNDTVSSSNGYYMAVGDELRLQTERGADYLAYIRATGTDGALSIMWGNPV